MQGNRGVTPSDCLSVCHKSASEIKRNNLFISLVFNHLSYMRLLIFVLVENLVLDGSKLIVNYLFHT